jgi:hypothetical protein
MLDPCRWCVTESAELDKFKLAGESTLLRKRMYDFEMFYHMSEEQIKEKVQARRAWCASEAHWQPLPVHPLILTSSKLPVTSPGASVRVLRCQHQGCNKPAYSLSELRCVADHEGWPRCSVCNNLLHTEQRDEARVKTCSCMSIKHYTSRSVIL